MEVEESLSEAEGQEENKKIDMSLDDIIRLQKEESDSQSTMNQTSQNGRIRRGNFQNKRYFRNPPRNQQGPSRLRPGFKQQRYHGVIRNNALGPITRQRAAASLSNVSPLNRPNLTSASTQNLVKIQTRKVQQSAKPYRAANIPVQPLGRRINTQNRRPQIGDRRRQQRTNIVNRNRRLTQQVAINRGKRQTNAGRWQNNDGFGSTLTVSVPNPKAGFIPQPKKPAMKRPGGRFRKTGAQSTDPPPKGVPLRFNFRAMANRTNVTLNERFSTLKIKGQYTPARRGGRTVMLA
ncbi:UAP56-interacting factor-like isoform X2 [Phyllobates terribilis]|uniref:UAP56-interacting factor-like isoform X2 n=1 Tax=Phyllobates terribilis TaxID=111132 RepID=UPI003CCAB9F6